MKVVFSSAICALLASCGSGTENSAIGNIEPPGLGAAITDEANLPPSIVSISLGCDLVLESISLSAGDNSNFTLTVDDESPLTLSYSIQSDDSAISTSTVNEDGVFTVAGVTPGQTTMPIVVTDEHGLSSELLLSVIVEG